MIRLKVSKKERKAHKRMVREEMSNLGTIADGLGSMTRDVQDAFGDNRNRNNGRSSSSSSRHNGGNDDSGLYKTTGMRKRRIDILEGGDTNKSSSKKKIRKIGATNTYQKSLYGSGAGGGKSKTKR